mgnify:CR=1 FL=1
MKALKEIGIKKAFGFLKGVVIKAFFNLLFLPPLRVIYLKFLGSKIGKDTIIHQIKMINLYRTGLKGLKVGSSCFLSDGVLLDLADNIVLEDHVTLAVRAMILTHTNVGYKDHPLQKHFPSFSKPVRIKKGCFIGANVVILPGVTIGVNSFVAAGAVVTKDIPSHAVSAGVPAKVIRKLS